MKGPSSSGLGQSTTCQRKKRPMTRWITVSPADVWTGKGIEGGWVVFIHLHLGLKYVTIGPSPLKPPPKMVPSQHTNPSLGVSHFMKSMPTGSFAVACIYIVTL